MFEHIWIIFTFFLGAGSGLLLWRWQQHQLALRSIYSLPSPPRKLLTGNALELIAAAKQGTYALKIFRWMKQYGFMIRLRLFTRPVLMVGKPQLIESILTEGQSQGIFTRSPAFYNAYKDVFGVHIGNETGEEWKWRRQVAVPAFRASQFTQKFDLIREGCEQVITQLENIAQTGKAVQVDPLFVNLTINIIAYFWLGVTFKRSANFVDEPPFDAQRLYAAFAVLEKHVLLQFSGRNQWFKFLPTSEGKEYRQAQDYLQQNFKPRVAMALQVARTADTESLSVSPSFCDSMLVKFAKNPKHDEDSLMAETWAYMFAGHDTTAHTMSFAVGELGLNSRVFQTAQKVVDEAWEKEGDLNLATLKNLDYIEAVIKETLRLHPVAPQIPLISTQETELDGIKIPKNVEIEPFFWAAGQDPQMYPSPEEFRPERWLEKAIDQQSPPLMFGFSRGAHLCVGASLALLEAKVMLSLLLRHFTWELVNGRDSLEDVDQHLTIFPRDLLPIRLMSRNNRLC